MTRRRLAILVLLVAGCSSLATLTRRAEASPTGRLSSRQGANAVFGGVGSWIDIFATQARAHPAGVIASLRQHGVTTLYLETSNYSHPVPVVGRSIAGAFIDDAHAAGIRVVAWYLPSLVRPSADFRRALGAIRFQSATGQRFDAFALDIEASLVKNVGVRNERLLALSRSLRRSAPANYPLGAIVPSPVGMRRHPRYWPQFPFAQLATTFDSFLPMAYFTHYARTPAAAYAYAHDVIAAIRSQSARPDVPIHIIGGIADDAPVSAFDAFIRAAADCDVTGISLYAFSQTSAAEWAALRGARLAPVPGATCRDP